MFAVHSHNVIDSAMSRRFLFVIPAAIACVLFFNAPASAQMYEGRRLVKASLVADTDAIVPGKPFTVGLLLDMASGWHTYWEYPGDAGIPTSIQWTLPPGFKAGEIQWPIPEKENDEGDLQSYVYTDEVLLMIEITPPAKIDAKEITLAGKASWLVCEKICVPGGSDVSLTLPVAAQSRPANADLFAKYRAQLPIIGDKDFEYQWKNGKDTAELGFQVPAGAASPAKADFFPLPAQGMTIEHPVVTPGDKGAWASIKIDSGSPDQLSGIAVREEGTSGKCWLVPPLKSAPPPAGQASNPAAGAVIASAPASAAEVWRYLVLGFFGGMLLNIMPCVLPVITLKIYGFINQAGQSRKRIFELGLAYCAGVFAWFLGLAALIVKLGLNWSFQFQNKGFVFAMLVICLLFGLSLIGLFEAVLPGALNTKLAALAGKEGLGGAFVHGLFTTLLGSACTAPLLGPAIGFALSQPPEIIFSFFATIAAGMALPYFLLTANPGWMRFLPKPGMWMVRVKQVLGVLVLATAAWFGYVFFQQVTAKPAEFAPKLASALKSGRPVFVDFTADWCINCKYNEKVVLKSAAVQEAFKQDNVLLLTADWTNGDQEITKLLKQFGRAGVPAYVLYPADSPDHPIVLPELLTQQTVLDGLKEAQEKSSVN